MESSWNLHASWSIIDITIFIDHNKDARHILKRAINCCLFVMFDILLISVLKLALIVWAYIVALFVPFALAYRVVQKS